MAITINGPAGQHRGRIGNTVYYMLNGQNVSRSIGRYVDPKTEKQRAERLKTKMCGKLFRDLNEFIKPGFSIAARGTTKNAFNLAVAFNRNNMFKGSYPDLEIEYPLLMLSMGNLTPAQNPKVTQDGGRLIFSWHTEKRMEYPMSADRVMVLAYFPKKGKTYMSLFMVERITGSVLLPIPASLKNEYMETYISFSSADREQISNSTYTGSFNKTTTI